MNVLATCTLGLDTPLLDRLADSVDQDIKWRVVVNNGPLGALEEFSRRHPEWIVKEPGNNLGCAGSWNYCATLFPDEPSLLIVNDDAYFLPGQLQRICEKSDAFPAAPLIYLNFSRPFYAFVWHKAGREQVGTFDENLWPAYYEDCDYRVRTKLLNLSHCPMVFTEQEPPVPHGKPRTGGDNYSALVNGCGLFNRAYWLKKWGTLNFEEAKYRTPYNDHRLKPSEWIYYPQERAMRYPLWNTFVNMPNPSIYE